MLTIGTTPSPVQAEPARLLALVPKKKLLPPAQEELEPNG